MYDHPIIAGYGDIVISFDGRIPHHARLADARARLESKALAPSLRP